MLEIKASISRDLRASNKDVVSQPIDDKWFVDLTTKKKIKAKWELNRNFQETWVTKFPWAKLIVGQVARCTWCVGICILQWIAKCPKTW